LVVLLLAVAVIEALATGKPIFHNLAYSLAGVLVLSYLWAWYNVNWIQLERETLSSRSQVGKVAEERFLLHNRGPLPKLWVEVRDHSDLPEHRASMALSSLGPGRRRGWTVRTTCWRRGRYRLGPLTIISGDPFGLFVRRQRLTATSSIVVYPLTADLPRFGSLTGELTGGGAVHRRTHYITPNVSGVREYYPGDTFNRIHWPSTARTGRLIVKEFELDPTADVWLFVDMEAAVQVERREDGGRAPGELALLAGRQVALDPSTEEYVVAVAASLTKHFIEHNRAVGLLAHSLHREMVQPDRSERQLTRILETLAVIRARGHVGIAQLLSAEGAAFGRNSVAVVITPSTETGWVAVLRNLRRRGVRGAGVVVDPASFGAPREATPVLLELADAGIPAYRVREGEPLVSALTNPATVS
ncbi:MAG: DUF58 domain-containing protein, partial [Anaerolineae bacterium]|nr:DUF58 domain-containing protein [Anaerolineae bacterium]